MDLFPAKISPPNPFVDIFAHRQCTTLASRGGDGNHVPNLESLFPLPCLLSLPSLTRPTRSGDRPALPTRRSGRDRPACPGARARRGATGARRRDAAPAGATLTHAASRALTSDAPDAADRRPPASRQRTPARPRRRPRRAPPRRHARRRRGRERPSSPSWEAGDRWSPAHAAERDERTRLLARAERARATSRGPRRR